MVLATFIKWSAIRSALAVSDKNCAPTSATHCPPLSLEIWLSVISAVTSSTVCSIDSAFLSACLSLFLYAVITSL